MIEPQLPIAMMQGCDATHRASNSDTHLTHGCIQRFCGFDGVLIASRKMRGCRNGIIPPLPVMAISIFAGAGR